MKKWCVLLLSIMFLLAACGQKYDTEINEVTKLEKADRDNSKKVDRKNSNFYVYEGGNVIVMSYQSLAGGTSIRSHLYKKNETTDKYEEDRNINAKKYMKNNEPDYKEENLKE
ncbi:cystatin-like fold lipoprotein [Staphylococcus caeli]|uniref:Lipoprotein, putative n=1 Tax=Staphylococcus caeli TaxID=2201815 RepID=A0A1D4PZD1_9STAP|nr:cystatin-like fold lipoprotein [Staphylococcus caeli]SCT28311.1 lipoprotein, putative [Staphylococcus caeli]SCT33811.1 lipoprotein, putative [Staphylococcus caeli]